MLDFKDVPTSILFVLLFTPGFVATRTYDLIVPRAERDYGKALYEVIGYSLLTYAVASPILIWWWRQPQLSIGLNILIAMAILIAVPALLSLAYLNLFRIPILSSVLVSPTPTSWDWAFERSSMAPHFVLVHLKDGRRVGGLIFKGSYTSTYPLPPDIFIPEVWQINQDTGDFIAVVPRTAGLVVLGNTIEMVEFFQIH